MYIHVSSEIEEAAKDAGDITVKRQKETIKKLAREVAACDSIAKRTTRNDATTKRRD